MTDEEWKSINEIYKKEFPDDMPFDKVSAKLDTMNNHPYIQELRSTFCNALVFVLTEGFVKYDDNTLDAYDGSLLRLVYENIEKLNKEYFFYWAFYYYLKKQYKECKENIHKMCISLKDDGALNEDAVFIYFLCLTKMLPMKYGNISQKK